MCLYVYNSVYYFILLYFGVFSLVYISDLTLILWLFVHIWFTTFCLTEERTSLHLHPVTHWLTHSLTHSLSCRVVPEFSHWSRRITWYCDIIGHWALIYDIIPVMWHHRPSTNGYGSGGETAACPFLGQSALLWLQLTHGQAHTGSAPSLVFAWPRNGQAPWLTDSLTHWRQSWDRVVPEFSHWSRLITWSFHHQ